MKNKLKWILIAEAVICSLFCIFGQSLGDVSSNLMAFPYAQIGDGLRLLSIANAVGNIIAFVAYLALCLAPIAYFLVRALKRKAYIENWLLILLSVMLFIVIYFMINPAYIGQYFGYLGIAASNKAFLGTVVHSIVIGYLVLRIIRRITNKASGSIFKHFKVLLAVICAVLVFGTFGTALANLIASIKTSTTDYADQMQNSVSILSISGITGFEQNLSLDYFSLILQYLVTVLPYMLGIAIIFSGLNLITALEADPYGEAVSAFSRKTGRLCRVSITATLLSQIGSNILHLALSSQITHSQFTLNIPLLSVVLMLAAMLLAGYFEKVRRLKHDNDMFI